MKYFAILFIFISTAAVCQSKHNIRGSFDIVNESSDPVDYLKRSGEFWVAYQVTPLDKRRSMCCWSSWKFADRTQTGCSLAKDGGRSFGSTHRSPDMNALTIFARIKDHRFQSILPVGDHCPVDLDGEKLIWLNQVRASDSLAWLETAINTEDHDNINNQALHALALHKDQSVPERLYSLAKQAHQDQTNNAIFWLGEAWEEAGFSYLKRLLKELAPGDDRRSINFALSQNETQQAMDLLLQISQQDIDDEQRADALFWMAESKHPHALQRLQQAVYEDQSHEVQQRALHGLASLETQQAADRLIDISRNHKNNETRGQALFWLAQSYPEKARPVLLEAIKDTDNAELIEQSVFAISQLPQRIADKTLIELIKGNYPRKVKKQALFWLAETADDGTIEELIALIGY